MAIRHTAGASHEGGEATFKVGELQIDFVRRRVLLGSREIRLTHYVRVFMAHLRHKLEAEPARPRYLLTEPGVGYRLAAE
ncbi:MAG TPA: winged helix-turn-helix domain-containing protein [Methylomirabilota bacterium]|nr:winged helix-turn-helix domain-containing protein [Methylomirabilota bacterium]